MFPLPVQHLLFITVSSCIILVVSFSICLSKYAFLQPHLPLSPVQNYHAHICFCPYFILSSSFHRLRQKLHLPGTPSYLTCLKLSFTSVSVRTLFFHVVSFIHLSNFSPVLPGRLSTSFFHTRFSPHFILPPSAAISPPFATFIPIRHAVITFPLSRYLSVCPPSLFFLSASSSFLGSRFTLPHHFFYCWFTVILPLSVRFLPVSYVVISFYLASHLYLFLYLPMRSNFIFPTAFLWLVTLLVFTCPLTFISFLLFIFHFEDSYFLRVVLNMYWLPICFFTVCLFLLTTLM